MKNIENFAFIARFEAKNIKFSPYFCLKPAFEQGIIELWELKILPYLLRFFNKLLSFNRFSRGKLEIPVIAVDGFLGAKLGKKVKWEMIVPGGL